MHLGIQFFIVRTAANMYPRGILTGKEWKTILTTTAAIVEWQGYQIVDILCNVICF